VRPKADFFGVKLHGTKGASGIFTPTYLTAPFLNYIYT
jgi:hypothetical protein